MSLRGVKDTSDRWLSCDTRFLYHCVLIKNLPGSRPDLRTGWFHPLTDLQTQDSVIIIMQTVERWVKLSCKKIYNRLWTVTWCYSRSNRSSRWRERILLRLGELMQLEWQQREKKKLVYPKTLFRSPRWFWIKSHWRLKTHPHYAGLRWTPKNRRVRLVKISP